MSAKDLDDLASQLTLQSEGHPTQEATVQLLIDTGQLARLAPLAHWEEDEGYLYAWLALGRSRRLVRHWPQNEQR